VGTVLTNEQKGRFFSILRDSYLIPVFNLVDMEQIDETEQTDPSLARFIDLAKQIVDISKRLKRTNNSDNDLSELFDVSLQLQGLYTDLNEKISNQDSGDSSEVDEHTLGIAKIIFGHISYWFNALLYFSEIPNKKMYRFNTNLVESYYFIEIYRNDDAMTLFDYNFDDQYLLFPCSTSHKEKLMQVLDQSQYIGESGTPNIGLNLGSP